MAQHEVVIAQYTGPMGISFSRSIPESWVADIPNPSHVTKIQIGNKITQPGDLTGAEVAVRIRYPYGSEARGVTGWGGTTWGVNKTNIESVDVYSYYTSGTSGELAMNGVTVWGYSDKEILLDQTTESIGYNAAIPSMPRSWYPNIETGQYITSIETGTFTTGGQVVATIFKNRL